MPESSLLLLTASDVQSLLAGQESKIIDLVRTAYEAHHRGESSLPHLTFPRKTRRI
jgi:hypothetical protein